MKSYLDNYTNYDDKSNTNYKSQKNIKIFGINFYEIFMKRYHMGVDAETPFATTEEYAKLVDLYEKVKEYYLLQNDK